ncbi:hypothetical protein CKAH01_14188 [Colletotrichum kahawae]|uniref:Uncharacterized protein n=1 Tax=Colletotrichum kahawae TaxID=34407 RepID=A0AAD9YL45_COLKA|nr:hypothetical protein CKAH01_14188 [Colletotrichum kahawae]
MLTDRDHLMYLGDHLGMDKRHCSGLIYSITEYLLRLRLITLASDYRSITQPTTYNPDHNPSILLLHINPQLLLADLTVR